MDEPVFIELRGDDERPGRDREESEGGGRPGPTSVLAVVAAILVSVIVVISLLGDDDDRNSTDGRGDPTTTEPEPEQSGLEASPRAPASLQAAECFALAPSADSLRAVFESIGGFEGLQVGIAEGAFDVVTFDPLDSDRLLAAHRAGYGAAENQDTNQQWNVNVRDGLLVQSLWDPATSHDFAHYNTDGTITMWVHGGDDVGFAPRDAVVIDRDGEVVTTTSSPIYADRFAVDAGTIFALVGNPYLYAPRDTGHLALLADDGERQTWLASGEDFDWIDVPTPGLLVAYPADPAGVTAVWDTRTLEPLEDHPLAGRPYQRVAIAGDGTTALGVTHDEELESLDLATGRTGDRFGHLDVTEVDRPAALSDDGAVAFTVGKSGTVSIWFVGDDAPIATFDASSGLPRWLPTSRSAARLTSSIAPDATRLALRIDATPQVGLYWRLIDIDIDSWLIRAGEIANDGLSPAEERTPLLTGC